MYQTVIVEDDPTISLLHRTFLARDNRFALAHAFSNGHEALEWLLHHTADLIILDVYMPGMTRPGTATHSPYGGDRHRCDHGHRRQRQQDGGCSAEAGSHRLSGQTLCRQPLSAGPGYLLSAPGSGLPRQCEPAGTGRPLPLRSPRCFHPKGLQTRTLDRIRACLRQIPQAGATCETIADCSGFSTVTVRRYLTYLVSQGEAVTQVNYDTGGRPCMLYRLPLP